LLHVVQVVPADLMRNALQVQNAYREYQERALAREGLRSMYVGTLSLSLILAVFAAILLAVILSGRLMRPLMLLSAGVAKVAAGDLQGQTAAARLMKAGDELGDLTQAFAQMTQQLAAAQVEKRRSMLVLEEAHTYLKTILDHQSSGVVVLDGQGNILWVNTGATRVLREPVGAYVGQSLAAVPHLAALAEKARALFMAQADEAQGASHLAEHWEKTFVLHDALNPASSEHGAQTHDQRTILARGVLLPVPDAAQQADWAGDGLWGSVMGGNSALGRHLLVLDDISATVSAQRSQAWADVARRLAHEIKNPLTPIQLSAERLEMKLGSKLEGADAQLLRKSVGTIVDQVAALKRLVDEFREYARLPAADLQATDLATLLSDMAQLYARAVVPVQWDIAPDLPAIMGDTQQLRQVVHNLVQNAQDAAQARYDSDSAGPTMGSQVVRPAQVQVQASISSSGERVRLLVRDNGAGFAPAILQRAFEPYITTKAKGTGLGLAVVKKIADEHHARLEISNILPAPSADAGSEAPAVLGAQIVLSFALAPSS
jgi:nitrogen fixation/metabolism regulation signal transduction histidine kinase